MPRFYDVIIDSNGSLLIELGANVDIQSNLDIGGTLRIVSGGELQIVGSTLQITSGGELQVVNGSIEVTGISARINLLGVGSVAGEMYVTQDGAIKLYNDGSISLYNDAFIALYNSSRVALGSGTKVELGNGAKIELDDGVGAAEIDFKGTEDSQLSGQLIGHPYIPLTSSMRIDGALHAHGSIEIDNDVDVTATSSFIYSGTGKSFRRSIALNPVLKTGTWTYTFSETLSAKSGIWVPTFSTAPIIFVVEVPMPLAAKAIDNVTLRYDGHPSGDWSGIPDGYGGLNVVIVEDTDGTVSRSSTKYDTTYYGVREIVENFGGSPQAFNATTQRLFITATTPYFSIGGTGFFDLLKLEAQFRYDVIQPG